MFKLLIVSAIVIGAICQSAVVKSAGNDDAHKAVKNLRAEVGKAITNAQTEFKKAIGNLKSTALQMEVESLNELDKDMVPLTKQLNQFIEIAKGKGDNKKCEKFVTSFNNVTKNFVNRSVVCIGTLVSQAYQQANDVVDSAQIYQEYTLTIDADIDNCKGNEWEKDQCYVKIIEKVNKETKEVPKEINEEVQNVLTLIPTLTPKLQTCVKQNFAEANKTATNDVNDYGLCAIFK